MSVEKPIDENSKIIIINAIKSFGVKGLSLLIAFFTTPAYMRYFPNNEVLGIWFTILSVLAWILNCDLGIGNGLRNQLVYCINSKDWEDGKRYISSSYIFLCIIGAVILCAISFAGMFVNWNRVFNISESVLSANILSSAIRILLVAIVLQFVLRLVTSILYALQQAFVPGFLNLITNVLMLAVVLLLNNFKSNNDFVLLAWVYLFCVNIPLVIATVWVFSSRLKNARPSIKAFRFSYATAILKVGGVFLLLQLVAMVVDNTNSYLITLFIGNAAVVEYQLYYKIFSLPLTMVMLLSTSLWSTITKAKAEENWKWLENGFKKFMFIVFGIAFCEFALVVPLQLIFNAWLGDERIYVNYGIAAIFAFSAAVMSWRTVVASFANGLCELKIQAIYMTIGAIINIPLAYVLSQEVQSYTAIVIANIISMLPFCVVQTVWCVRYLKKMRGGKNNARNEAKSIS